MAGLGELARISQDSMRRQQRDGELGGAVTDEAVMGAAKVFGYEALQGHIGDAMTVVGASPAMQLTLRELERTALDGAEWEAFALYLEGDPKRLLPQGTYRLAHPAFGEHDLFLSPKSPVQYEISISRRRGV